MSTCVCVVCFRVWLLYSYLHTHAFFGLVLVPLYSSLVPFMYGNGFAPQVFYFSFSSLVSFSAFICSKHSLKIPHQLLARIFQQGDRIKGGLRVRMSAKKQHKKQWQSISSTGSPIESSHALIFSPLGLPHRQSPP